MIVDRLTKEAMERKSKGKGAESLIDDVPEVYWQSKIDDMPEKEQFEDLKRRAENAQDWLPRTCRVAQLGRIPKEIYRFFWIHQFKISSIT